MGFFGTTPQIVSQYLSQRIIELKPQRVFVPFAGNFVVEQVCGVCDPSIEVHSTDVSLYSRAIGYALSDTESEITLKPELFIEYPVFEDKKSPLDIAIAVIFFCEAANHRKKQEIPYYRNLYKDSIQNQEAYYEQIKEKILKFKENCKNITFYGIDGVQLSKMPQEGDLCFYDPPVLLGDYEKMFAEVEKCFDFDQPDYTQMEDEVKLNDLIGFTDRGVTCFYRTNNPTQNIPDGYKEVFRYQYKYHANYCIYSNIEAGRFVGRFSPMKEENPNYEIISREDVFSRSTKIKILPVDSKIGNHYRIMWVKKAEMTNQGHPFLVFADDKLIGMFQLHSAMGYGHDKAVLISDPASPTSRYKRLSKLIIMIASTKEVLDKFNEMVLWEHVGLTTRVLTNADSSMKYRGVFTLAEKKKMKEGNYKHILIYQNTENIYPTIRSAFTYWFDKYEKKQK